jgi:hypothetical protein
MNGGGGSQVGSFQVCEECMQIDGCREAEGRPGFHASHWGSYPHPAAACDEMNAAREKRRARYLAKQKKVTA